MSENDGDLITFRHDKRITKIGKILRMTKIDEIPQLLNILKGDMRFIGPRPEVPNYFEKSSFKFLMSVKPGISDYSSILFRDEERILEKIGGNNPYLQLLPIKLKLAEYYSRKKAFIGLKIGDGNNTINFFPNYSSKTLIAPSLVIDLPVQRNFLRNI